LLYAWKAFGFFFACVALSGIITDMIKPIVGRARPVLLDREGFYGLHPFTFHVFNYNSLPSGHTTTGFAVAFALAALWPRGKWWFVAFGVLVGLSRIMVNAHFVSDVVAGTVVGILTVAAVRKLFRKYGIFPIDVRIPPR
jgi:undecaprenyl-diphosphatase